MQLSKRLQLSAVMLLGISLTGFGQSLPDSTAFRKAFLKIFNGRMKHFHTIVDTANGNKVLVELPGDNSAEVNPFYGGLGDSNYVYEAKYYLEDKASADRALMDLQQLVRISLKPFVFVERTEMSGTGPVTYFFQSDKDFYYDSYIETEQEYDKAKQRRIKACVSDP